MLLIKCKCGCLFTIKDDASPVLPATSFFCQNCGSKVQYFPDRYTLSDLKNEFSDVKMTVQKIPDNADITITFKA